MNVNIPRRLKDKEWEDREAVLIAFMVMVCQKEGYESWFNFNAADLKKIVGKPKSAHFDWHGPNTKGLRQVFDFAAIDENNVMVKWKINDSKFWHTRPRITGKFADSRSAVVPHRINDLYRIKMWCYLMGHISSGNTLCSSNDSVIHYTDSNLAGNGGVGVEFLVHENTKFH
mgnify:CR=1 FL=1